MKFIHIADVHLGAEPEAGLIESKERASEIWETLEHVIGVCESEKTDLLLIAGDLFHRQPLKRELKEVDYLFSQLSHTKVVLIAGNHDYIRQDSNYRTFRWSENVYPLFGDSPEYIEFPELKTSVYGFSYHRKEITEPLYDKTVAADTAPIEILLAHGGDARHIPIDFRALERAGFDYVAMGHIHKPQAVRKNKIIYSGALEPVDINDTGAHGYIRGEIDSRGTRTSWVPCAVRSYIHSVVESCESDTNGSLKDKIEKFINNNGNENIYKFTISGKRNSDVVYDTDRLARAGNILEILDETVPSFDFEKLYRENEDGVLGRFIHRLKGYEEGSVEYRALCEGVDALVESRGQKI